MAFVIQQNATTSQAHIIYTKLFIIQINDYKLIILYYIFRYIESQFEHINQHIQELTEEKKRQIKHTWATSSSYRSRRHMASTETTKQLVWILM